MRRTVPVSADAGCTVNPWFPVQEMALGAAIALKRDDSMMQEAEMKSLLLGMLATTVLTMSMLAAMAGALCTGLRASTTRTKPVRRNGG